MQGDEWERHVETASLHESGDGDGGADGDGDGDGDGTANVVEEQGDTAT